MFKKSVLFLTAVLMSVLTVAFTNTQFMYENKVSVVNAQSAESVEPYGLLTSLTLKIDHKDGKVYALVKNEFTLFPATVIVKVELYSSTEYKNSCSEMTLESSNYIGDLNIGKSITAEKAIDGVQRYWRARMEYKIDEKDWEYKETQTKLYDINGNVVE